MKRRLSAIWILILLLSAWVQAEELPALEDVSAVGFLEYEGRAVGLIRTSEQARLITVGLKLGDFQVEELSAEAPFVFVAGGERYAVEWFETQSVPPAGEGEMRVRLDYADIVYVAKAVAKLTGRDFYCGPKFVGGVEYTGSLSPEELLARLALGGESFYREELQEEIVFHYDSTETYLTVGTKDTIRRVRGVLEDAPRGTQKVTFDFVNADLGYVLETLARELSIKGTFPTTETGVTIEVSNAPATLVLELCLALQEQRYVTTWAENSVRVLPK